MDAAEDFLDGDHDGRFGAGEGRELHVHVLEVVDGPEELEQERVDDLGAVLVGAAHVGVGHHVEVLDGFLEEVVVLHGGHRDVAQLFGFEAHVEGLHELALDFDAVPVGRVEGEGRRGLQQRLHVRLLGLEHDFLLPLFVDVLLQRDAVFVQDEVADHDFVVDVVDLGAHGAQRQGVLRAYDGALEAEVVVEDRGREALQEFAQAGGGGVLAEDHHFFVAGEVGLVDVVEDDAVGVLERVEDAVAEVAVEVLLGERGLARGVERLAEVAGVQHGLLERAAGEEPGRAVEDQLGQQQVLLHPREDVDVRVRRVRVFLRDHQFVLEQDRLLVLQRRHAARLRQQHFQFFRSQTVIPSCAVCYKVVRLSNCDDCYY